MSGLGRLIMTGVEGKTSGWEGFQNCLRKPEEATQALALFSPDLTFLLFTSP